MCMANRAAVAGLAFVACVTARIAPARADDALSEIATMVRELRYEEALSRIEQLRAADDTSPDMRLRALELAALAHVGLGRVEDAREAFRALLTLDPGAELGLRRPSPRIVEIFQSVRASVAEAEPTAGLTTTLSRSGARVVAEATP